jgi:hypothetical protein
MSDPRTGSKGTSHRDAEREPAHGGRAGWFRVACGFAILATIGLSDQAWSVARTSATDTIVYPSAIAALLAVGALLLAMSSVLAFRRRPMAGFFLLLGYLLPAIPLYVLQDVVVPPSLFLDASMIALILATGRRGAITHPAA